MAGQGNFPPRLERPALQPLRLRMPAADEEGYDPHEEHRKYVFAQQELEKTQEELAAAIESYERQLAQLRAAAAPKEEPRRDWKRAIVLSELLNKPVSRRR